MPACEPFPRILSDLAARKATGTLKVTAGSVVREIYLKQGKVIQAYSRNMKEALGRVLLDQGWVTEDELDLALDLAAAGKRQLGDVLIGEGTLTPAQVVEALTEQVKLRVFNLFRVSEYEHTFTEDALPELHFQVRLLISTLVVEGVGFCFSVDRILDVLVLSEDTTVRATQGAASTGERLSLGPREQRLLQQVGQATTIETLIATGEHSYLKLLRFLFALWCLRLLEVVPKDEPGAGTIEMPTPSQAASEARSEVEVEASPEAKGAQKRMHLDVDDPDDPRRAALRRQLLDRYRKHSRQPTATSVKTSSDAKQAAARKKKKRRKPRTLADDLTALYLKLPRLDYFDLLQISVKATVSEVKIAYGGFLRRWRLEHLPDEWSDEVKVAAAALLDKATEALMVLQEPDRRRQYLQQRAAGGATTFEGDEKLLLAGVAQQKARRARERGEGAAAEAILRAALEKVPEEASLHLLLGMVLVDRAREGDPRVQEEAVTVLRKAAALDPSLDLPWINIAKVAESRGEVALAHKLYRKALSVNPESAQAAAGLAILEKNKGKSSLMDRLLGKK